MVVLPGSLLGEFVEDSTRFSAPHDGSSGCPGRVTVWLLPNHWIGSWVGVQSRCQLCRYQIPGTVGRSMRRGRLSMWIAMLQHSEAEYTPHSV